MDFSVVKKSDVPAGAKTGSNGRGLPPHHEDEEAPDLGLYHMVQPNRIAQFIQQNLIGCQPGGKPARLSLRHIEAGNRPGPKVGDQDLNDFDLKDIGTLAVGLFTAAENDAIGLGGEQRYVLFVFLDGDLQEPASRLIFAVNPDEKSLTKTPNGQSMSGTQRRYESMDSNPPNEQGVINQVMRHNTVLNNQNLAVVTMALGLVRSLQEQNDRLMRRGAEEEDRRYKNMDIIERAKSEDWARQKEVKLLEAEVDNKKAIVGMLKDVVAPAILRRIGAADPKQRIRADDEQEMKLAVALAGDRYEKIMAILGDDQGSSFAFAEWMAFNIDRAMKVERNEPLEEPEKRPTMPAAAVTAAATVRQQQEAAAAAGAQPAQAQGAAAGAAAGAGEAAALRAAELKKSKEQAEWWANHAKSIEAYEQKLAAEAAAAAEAAKPVEQAAAEPTKPTTKKAKAAAKAVEPPAAAAEAQPVAPEQQPAATEPVKQE